MPRPLRAVLALPLAAAREDRARAAAEREQALTHEALRELPMLADIPRDEWSTQCVRTKRPSR